MNKKTLRRFVQPLQNLIKVNANNPDVNLTKYAKIQSTDSTEINYPNQGGFDYNNGLSHVLMKKMENYPNL